MACASTIRGSWRYRGVYSPVQARYDCIKVISDADESSYWGENADIFGICWVIYWMADEIGQPTPDDAIHKGYKHNLLAAEEIKNAVLDVPRTRFCQQRVWSLITATSRGIANLPWLTEALLNMTDRLDGAHVECTAQTCLLGDENSTAKPQLHYPRPQEPPAECPCPPLHCDMRGRHSRYLVQVDRTRRPNPAEPDTINLATVDWVEDLLEPLTRDTPYMAISHVWLDGTGRGDHPPGSVNTCLFSFFNAWAINQGCEAIWWDVLCIPVGEARKEALSWMHKNFFDAKVILVHDRELTRLPWTDDEQPCLALALSTWFSRGWTALELAAAKSEDAVKVVFRHPSDRNKQVVKSLRQILAGTSGAKPVHKAVSDVIRRIIHFRERYKDKRFDAVSEILAILEPRYTCWLKDRHYIAALLADIRTIEETAQHSELDPGGNQKNFTQFIVREIGRVWPSSLLHGNVTMADSGGWSWCPMSIFDLARGIAGEEPLRLDRERGTVRGTWETWAVTESMVVTAADAHISVHVRVVEALQSPRDLLILSASRGSKKTNSKITKDVRFLLVKTFEPTQNRRSSRRDTTGSWLDCQYIGTVKLGVACISYGRDRGILLN
ncbi:hypothetical protein AYL99_08460 [Fonsecaea erecta]|uniref:Heterokaryon incompatibility domain-containing protein n=1 Tax=Fonsecaea erecta TaxID=1367422 RepID=A0A178ZDI7_9EURO|nr:hypothetical protein AYL99_08460 [Fonsecaea erecta]OAP57722.1 hypothetical protein AYL99_08460 [Fonsecaea erecta]